MYLRLSIPLAVIFMMLSPAFARPVSYPGGWTLITENDGTENSFLTHYTFTPRLAVGYRFAYDRDTKDPFHGLQLNTLVKRWNNPDSQANIYFKGAVGLVDQHRGATGEGFGGLQADWENRRFMIMYGNRATLSGDTDRRKFMQQVGVGVAPYVAEFGALHTWIMPHIIHEPKAQHHFQFAPMLRFFKGTILTEIGYNVTTSTPVANAMLRF